MKLFDLFENNAIDIYGNLRSRESFDRMATGAPKQASFVFIRANPPTLGHGALLNKLASTAIGGEYYIFASKSNDATDNPLDYETKLRFIESIYPQHSQHIVTDLSIRTPLQAADWLYSKGIRALTMVAGSDRLEDFKKMLESWNSPEIRKQSNRDKCFINLVSGGEREDGATGLAGISATNARAAARNNNLKYFMETTGTSGRMAEQLFKATRRGMGIS